MIGGRVRYSARHAAPSHLHPQQTFQAILGLAKRQAALPWGSSLPPAVCTRALGPVGLGGTTAIAEAVDPPVGYRPIAQGRTTAARLIDHAFPREYFLPLERAHKQIAVSGNTLGDGPHYLVSHGRLDRRTAGHTDPLATLHHKSEFGYRRLPPHPRLGSRFVSGLTPASQPPRPGGP